MVGREERGVLLYQVKTLFAHIFSYTPIYSMFIFVLVAHCNAQRTKTISARASYGLSNKNMLYIH